MREEGSERQSLEGGKGNSVRAGRNGNYEGRRKWKKIFRGKENNNLKRKKMKC